MAPAAGTSPELAAPGHGFPETFLRQKSPNLGEILEVQAKL